MKNIYSSPYISIIIPLYINAEGLSKCISAVENQSYSRKRFKVIIVNNGSKDNPKEVFKNYIGNIY